MNSMDYLKKEHEEIFWNLLEFEGVIDRNDLDYEKISYIFHKITNLLQQHKQNEEILLSEVNNDNMKIPESELILDPRRVNGHIRVINEALLSKNPDFIKISLDNDGRMLVSIIKNHVFGEERVLGRLLFLQLIQQ